MAAPGFWDDADAAQATVAKMQKLKAAVGPLEELVETAGDLEVMIEFAEAGGDEASTYEEEIRQTLPKLEQTLERVELKAMMSSPADPGNAYLSVQAGEGGTDAADWSQMLLRMYQRWAERNGYETELLDMSEAEEAGIRGATMAIRGEYAFGYLRGENGNHRLIRNSPFDSAGRRQTSFAAIDVTPEPDDDLEIEINWDSDVREDTYRASGAGGQHVNKTDSAIRLTHLPTGVVSQCQSERSQHKNRASARKMLQAKLYQMEIDKRDAETAARRGEKSRIGFGGETIRSYVFNPDQYVKDARTGHKVGNYQPILDGEIDEFLEAFLRSTL